MGEGRICAVLPILEPIRVIPPLIAPAGMAPPNGVRRSIWCEDSRLRGGWISWSSGEECRERLMVVAFGGDMMEDGQP